MNEDQYNGSRRIICNCGLGWELKRNKRGGREDGRGEFHRGKSKELKAEARDRKKFRQRWGNSSHFRGDKCCFDTCVYLQAQRSQFSSGNKGQSKSGLSQIWINQTYIYHKGNCVTANYGGQKNIQTRTSVSERDTQAHKSCDLKPVRCVSGDLTRWRSASRFKIWDKTGGRRNFVLRFKAKH